VYRLRGTAQRVASIYIEHQRRPAAPFPDPELLLGLRAVALRERPDVVHAHNWLKHSWLPLRPLCSVPLVVTLHDYSHVCAKKTLMMADDRRCPGPAVVRCTRCSSAHYGRLKGTAIAAGAAVMGRVERASTDMFIAVSRAVADRNKLEQHQLPFRVIPNFLPDEMAAVDEREPLPSPQPGGGYILFVGDLRRFKGVHTLLRAYERLTGPPPLVLAGRRCPDTPDLPAGARHLGTVPHASIPRLWRDALFGVAPSVGDEPFGIGALEGMLAGRPIIASAVGGLPEVVVDEHTGILVPPGDEAALAAAMQRMLDNSGLRTRMGQAGARRAEHFRARNVVPRIEDVYSHVSAVGHPVL
jgi:glycosyltransferase involved in cell wall biosynthesis